MKRISVFLLAVPIAALAALVFTSCGSSLNDQQTFFCCPRDVMQFYSCPDQDSFTRCWNESNPSDCTADPSRDIGCPTLWPSGPLNQHK